MWEQGEPSCNNVLATAASFVVCAPMVTLRRYERRPDLNEVSCALAAAGCPPPPCWRCCSRCRRSRRQVRRRLLSRGRETTLAPVDPPRPPRVPQGRTAESPEPDAVRTRANASGAPVEVLAKRSATSSAFVDAEGLLTLRSYAAPVHVQRDGAWVDVDTRLVPSTNGVAAKAVPAAALIGGGAPSGTAGRLLAVGAQAMSPTDLLSLPIAGTGGLTVGWQGSLPAASLSEGSASFATVASGVDLRVEARRGGTEFSAVLADRGSAPQVLRLPLRAPGWRFGASDKDGRNFGRIGKRN